MNPFSVIIQSVGVYLPKKKVTNDELSTIVDTSDEWIMTRTGIRNRRIASSDETTSWMGAQAAKEAIKNAGIDPYDIDLLIVATMTPDMLFPATACLIQKQLGLRPVPSFDVEIACSGFVYILEIATRMLQAGSYKHALIIGAEKISGVLDWKDRATCVLFGDGAGAAVLSRVDQPGVGVLGTQLGADGAQADMLSMPAGGSAMPITPQAMEQRLNFLKMNGRDVFKFAVRTCEAAIVEILNKHNLSIEDIDCIVPHQANLRILESLSQKLNIPIEKFFCNLQDYGNTSAASIPIALYQALNEGRIRSGSRVLLLAFGAGASWGSALIYWH